MMKILDIKAMLSPQSSYTDLAGKAALSWDKDEHTALIEVAKICNIDTLTYEPVGMRVSLTRKGFNMTLYIAKRTPELNGKRSVKSVLTNMKHDEFYSLAKNINVSLFDPHEDHNALYEYVGEESLSEVVLRQQS